ncbi:MAG: hypothetical protein N2516_03370 [Dictyoglomaceae bacterium]|nr:hypothetical protein [Dictyoglomaceae bacterium]
MNNSYLKKILPEIPRLLGFLDKNLSSPNFGCFDRNYWHYSITDFPCARFQEAVLTLTLLYNLKEPDNRYFNNDNILLFIKAGINFWCRIQKRDGSFDEWYPNEHSFVATAFSTYAISEALLLLRERIEDSNKIIKYLKKAGDFLFYHEDFTACNQVAGSIIALYNIYLLTSEEKYKKGALLKLEKLEKIQREEGWFPEYQGPDIGYLSLTIDYLSKFYEKTKEERVKNMIDKALNFLAFFSHPDLSFGGEYGSRNTKYIIPSGIEYSARWNKSARRILSSLRKAIIEDKSVSPFNLDDRYLAYIGYTYIQAYENFYEGELLDPLYKEEFSKFFPESGIFIESNENFYIIGNLRKEGTIRVDFKKTGFSLRDSGPIIYIKNKKYSSFLNLKSKILLDYGYSVEGNLLRIPFNYMTPLKSLILKLLQILLGWNKVFSFFVKKLLRSILISYKRGSNVSLKRNIYIQKEKIVIEDEISSPVIIDKIIIGTENPYIYVPSSRYFQIQDLKNYYHILEVNKSYIKIRREYDNKGQEKLYY